LYVELVYLCLAQTLSFSQIPGGFFCSGINQTQTPLDNSLNLSEADKAILAHRMTTRNFVKNTMIFNDQTNLTALCIVEKGRVKVVKSRDNGKEVILAMYSSGDYFGTVTFADDDPLSEFVVTMERSRLSLLKKRDIEPILLRNPNLSLTLMKDLARRLRQAYRRIESLALMDVYERVTQLRNELAERRDSVLIRNANEITSLCDVE
jgi:CRP/FNR family cyclic AMP-dependent transcriptional regulator